MRNADALGDRAGVVDVLAGAAGALAMGRGAMVVELQRHADDVVAASALSSAAVTEESTPPDMATTTRVSAGRPSISRLLSMLMAAGFRYEHYYRRRAAASPWS